MVGCIKSSVISKNHLIILVPKTLKKIIFMIILLAPVDKGLFPHWCEGFNPPISHNISDHLSKLHGHSVITTSFAGLQNMRIKAIKKVLKKQ